MRDHGRLTQDAAGVHTVSHIDMHYVLCTGIGYHDNGNKSPHNSAVMCKSCIVVTVYVCTLKLHT